MCGEGQCRWLWGPWEGHGHEEIGKMGPGQDWPWGTAEGFTPDVGGFRRG